MLFRVSAIVLAIAASVVAAPTGDTTNQCNGGTLSCCNTNALSVLSCTPINILGIGSGGSCSTQPTCCTNVSSNGLVNWECSPLNINL